MAFGLVLIGIVVGVGIGGLISYTAKKLYQKYYGSNYSTSGYDSLSPPPYDFV